MLVKLLKYEMKAGARMIPVVYLAIAGIFLTGLISKALNIPQIRATASFLLGVAGVAAVIMTIVFVVFRFYKSLFGAEGYLSQTLPVKKSQLVLSKLIVAYIWMILSITAAGLAFAAILYLNDVKHLFEIIRSVFGGSFTPLVVYAIVLGCTQLLAFLGELYFAVTLANTRIFIRNNIVFSVVFYFAANFVVGLLEMAAMLFIPLGVSISSTDVNFAAESMATSIDWNALNQSQPIVNTVNVGIGSGFVDILAGVVFLMLACWMLEKKTSVK